QVIQNTPAQAVSHRHDGRAPSRLTVLDQDGRTTATTAAPRAAAEWSAPSTREASTQCTGFGPSELIIVAACSDAATPRLLVDGYAAGSPHFFRGGPRRRSGGPTAQATELAIVGVTTIPCEVDEIPLLYPARLVSFDGPIPPESFGPTRPLGRNDDYVSPAVDQRLAPPVPPQSPAASHPAGPVVVPSVGEPPAIQLNSQRQPAAPPPAGRSTLKLPPGRTLAWKGVEGFSVAPYGAIDVASLDDAGVEETAEITPGEQLTTIVQPPRIAGPAVVAPPAATRRAAVDPNVTAAAATPSGPAPLLPPIVAQAPSAPPRLDWAPQPELLAPPVAMPPAPPASREWRLSLFEAIQLGVTNNRDVRVLGHAPRIVETEVAQECSVFDPVLGATAYGGRDDRQVRSLIESQGSLLESQRTDFLDALYDPNQLFVRRRLYTGGEFTYGFATNYLNYSPPGDFLFLNPGWDSNINARLRQPLGAGRGYDVNVAPLRIAQAVSHQSRLEFVSQVRQIVQDIEIAYWTLAGARRELQILQESRAIAARIVNDERDRMRLGQSSQPDVIIARALEETLALNVAEAERKATIASDQLRQVLGLTVFGGSGPGYGAIAAGTFDQPLVPVVTPEDVNVDLDWPRAVQTSMTRPELASQRAAIRAANLAMYRARNGLLPDVSVQADYAVTGLEEDFGNSLATIGRHDYNRWGVGVYYERPLGMRSANALVRRTQLEVSREQARLRKLEHDIVHQLRQSYDNVRLSNAIWLQQQQRVDLLKEQVNAFTDLYREGRVELFRLLEAEQNLAVGQVEANVAWTAARVAEAQWRFQKCEDPEYFTLTVEQSAKRRRFPPFCPGIRSSASGRPSRCCARRDRRIGPSVDLVVTPNQPDKMASGGSLLPR
ncbi:MAG TPA: TolC family protein, partial [Lacipirellulaceae bacterium]|nr:TolC family protein [Lacipirellulaceae bacterium]